MPKNGDTRRQGKIESEKGGNSTLSAGDGQPPLLLPAYLHGHFFYRKDPAVLTDGIAVCHACDIVCD